MKRITIGICFILAVFLAACGKQTIIESVETEQIEQKVSEAISTENEVQETEQQYELSELELQIEEFKNNTPSEITITQDLLRGEWHVEGIDIILEEIFPTSDIELGEIEVSYDNESKDSTLIFTNNEFKIVYDDATIYYGEDNGKELRSAIIVSGLYRVSKTGEYNEFGGYDSEIEMMITEVSPKYGSSNAEWYAELNSTIGTIVKKPIDFWTLYSDLSDMSGLTQERIDDYNLEIHEQVDVFYDGGYGFREDGSYGLIKYDTPIKESKIPGMMVVIRGNNRQILPNAEWYYKTNNSVNVSNREVESGVILYDIEALEDGTVEE